MEGALMRGSLALTRTALLFEELGLGSGLTQADCRVMRGKLDASTGSART
jgi:hypothetical protein